MKRSLLAWAVVGLNAALFAGTLPDETCDVLVVGGGAAALAVARGVDLRRIDIGELKARLKSRGCIVPKNGHVACPRIIIEL